MGAWHRGGVAEDLIACYRGGDYIAAWDEACRQAGSAEARAVADEMMRRVVMADPLVLPSAAWMLYELTEWDANNWCRCQPKRPWRFALAPDEVLKAGISGRTQALLLPTADPDPVIENADWQRPGVTLVGYLRASLRFAGFPGFEFRPPVPQLIMDLQRTLIPF
jgi:hypothetical protein